jgi:DNA-binding response OmpR family regulator
VSEAVGVTEDGAVSPPQPRPVILDLGLPDGDGIQICTPSANTTPIPVLVLSARDSEQENGLLDAGPTTMSKPFGGR